MTPCKIVHINVPEKAFYLHQRDNGLNFVLVTVPQLLEEQIDHFAVLVCAGVLCLCFFSTGGGVSIEEHSTAFPQENYALRGV